MSEQKESSVLFSLQELMGLEQDRIKNEEADKQAKAQAAERARVEAERAQREAEESRIRAEEERRRMEEARAREEAARLEAIRLAEVEKARIEAEQRARLEAMAAQQQHERSLAELKHDGSKKKLRNMLIIGGVVLVAVVGGSGAYLYTKDQEAKALAAAQAAERAQLDEEKRKLEAEKREAQAKIDNLSAQLTSAKDEATRAKIQAEIDAAKAAQAAPKGGGGPIKPAGGAKTGGSKCTPGDPLCSDL